MSKKNMKQIYFRRRVLAIVIIIVILLIIFRACSSRSNRQNQENNTNQQNQIIEENNPNANLDEAERQINNNNNTENNDENTVDGTNNEEDNNEIADNQEDTNDNTNNEENNNATKEVALNSHLEEMRDHFVEHAEIDYNTLDNSVEFSLVGDFKDSIDRIFENDGTSSDLNDWEDFKDEVVKASESITEQIEPGIEFKVINPGGMTEVILNVKDGSVTFDLVSE